jgi:hypothetical protein
MTEGLAGVLFDLLAERRRQGLARGWPEIPEWVFCSDVGTALEERNFSREWYRLRRRTEKEGIRPLKLHAARHPWATFALQAGKSLRWVADQLGHADPGFTLRVYAHAMRDDESDLSFAEFGGSERLYPAPADGVEAGASRNTPASLVGRQGLEPWTLGLKERSEGSGFPFDVGMLRTCGLSGMRPDGARSIESPTKFPHSAAATVGEMGSSLPPSRGCEAMPAVVTRRSVGPPAQNV